MKRTLQGVFVATVAAQVLVTGQAVDVNRILAQVRTALGGEAKLAAVKTIAIEGRQARAAREDSSTANDFEMAFELPDKFMKKEVAAVIGATTLSRRTGFNGAALIEEMDELPMMHGAPGMHVFRVGPGPGGAMPGGRATPEQIEAQRQLSLRNSRREFARLTAGMLATSFPVYPLEFSYGGQAESADGKADVINVKGPEDFAARLFVDANTHLPLMLSWMDKEPLRIEIGGPGRGGGMQIVTRGGATSPEDAERMQQEIADRMKEAEAKRRVVEYRLIYADFKAVDGVKLPTRIQRMIDGLATEELTLEKVKLNQKIDPKKFEPVR